MKEFLLTALLRRELLDTMSLKVRAQDKEHAYEIAKSFLEAPGESAYSVNVPFYIIENRDVVSTETLELE